MKMDELNCNIMRFRQVPRLYLQSGSRTRLTWPDNVTCCSPKTADYQEGYSPHEDFPTGGLTPVLFYGFAAKNFCHSRQYTGLVLVTAPLNFNFKAVRGHFKIQQHAVWRWELEANIWNKRSGKQGNKKKWLQRLWIMIYAGCGRKKHLLVSVLRRDERSDTLHN